MGLGNYNLSIDFIAELTQHIPPKHKHLIRYYGLYSSWTKGKAKKAGDLVKFGYNPAPTHERVQNKDSNIEMEILSSKASRQSWARLIQKVSYEVDHMVCPKCSHALETSHFLYS